MDIKKIYPKFKEIWFRIRTSIAYYPTLSTIFAIIMCFVSIAVDDSVQFESFITVDSAKDVVSTVASGAVSLLVFSFSMVMIIFTMNTTNLTPRVIPSLIQQKIFQIVLSVYLSTITWSFITLMSFDQDESIPMITFVINIILLFLSLAMFIRFIDQVSTQIQVTNIIDQIWGKTVNRIKEEIEDDTIDELPSYNNVIRSPRSDYFWAHSLSNLNLPDKKGNIIVNVVSGDFVYKGDILMYHDMNLSEEEEENLVKLFSFSKIEDINIHWRFGIDHLKEIINKAMSPGINDPGTAKHALNRLGDIFDCLKEISDYSVKEKDDIRIIETGIRLKPMVGEIIHHIKIYSDQDPEINLYRERLMTFLDLETVSNQ